MFLILRYVLYLCSVHEVQPDYQRQIEMKDNPGEEYVT